MHNFEKLKIWQKAMDIAVEVYEVYTLLPNDEKFNLIHQIKNVQYLFLLTSLKVLEEIMIKNSYNF
ncbi:hypothetical protein FPS14_contig00017-0023 [Flavobacterium psychrophilum]|nr:hypothetical protein FPS14_contig00017-0023 [Flavobacterium psychrophilum]